MTPRKLLVLIVMVVASFAAGYGIAWIVLLLGWPSEPIAEPKMRVRWYFGERPDDGPDREMAAVT